MLFSGSHPGGFAPDRRQASWDTDLASSLVI